MRTKGFTLIELLIVVAIIAILAAIAVPNFLEAQTRAKVSRTKADMRTIATALESYRVDYNNYPYGDGLGDGRNTHGPRPGTARLTTPVGYITSVPEDVFAPRTALAPAAGFIHPYTPAFFYVSSRPGGFPSYPLSISAWSHLVGDYRINALEIPPTASSGSAYINETAPVFWQLRSLGPNQYGNSSFPYDPTNGTISDGDISLFGPGNAGKNSF